MEDGTSPRRGGRNRRRAGALNTAQLKTGAMAIKLQT